MKRFLYTALALVTLVLVLYACDSDVVDVDKTINGKSLTGAWIIDCDSASDGNMQLSLHESNEYYVGTASIFDTTYTIAVHYHPYDNGWGEMWIVTDVSIDLQSGKIELRGDLSPSMDMMRAKLTVSRNRSGEIAFEDFATVFKQ